ncbi:hypothetical protein Tco_0069741, partial [Tanacetum coccineum]
VPDESTVVPATSSEGTGTKRGVPDEEKVTSEANVILDWGSEQESEYSEEDDDENIDWVDTDEEEEKDDDDDDKSIDLEKTDDEETVQDDDEETNDELVHVDEQVNNDEDEEMTNAKDADTGNGDEEITDTTKVEAEKTEDTTDAEINSLLDVQIQQEIPHIQSLSVLIVPVSVISKTLVIIPILETPSVAPAITTLLPPPSVSTISPVLLQSITPIPTPLITTKAPPVTTILDPLPAIIQRVYVFEKDVQELKEADNTTTLRASFKFEIPSAVNVYLGSILGDALQKVLQKHTEELIQKYPRQVDYKEMI